MVALRFGCTVELAVFQPAAGHYTARAATNSRGVICNHRSTDQIQLFQWYFKTGADCGWQSFGDALTAVLISDLRKLSNIWVKVATKYHATAPIDEA